MGSIGWLRSSAWTWLFSSTHKTRAWSGGSRYSPTTSRSFSMNQGSVDSLKLRVRWGCRPKSWKKRWTALFETPVSAAMARTVQCVPACGFVVSVLVSRAATASSSIVRGRPLRSSSYKPASRWVMKRWRHLPTVCALTPSSVATAWLLGCRSQANTMRARCVNPAGRLRARTSAPS
jgi:hypothetical protein